MPKMRRLKHKQHGGVKVSFLQPDGSYTVMHIDLQIIKAIFQNCIDTYLISASSASGMVFGATLPPLADSPGILLRSNQVNEDGTLRTQEQIADRERYVNDGLIVPNCCLKISFVETPASSATSVNVGKHKKQTCRQADLDNEVRVQNLMFLSSICGTTAPLTFTPDKIAATTMTASEFTDIVDALDARYARHPPPHPPPHPNHRVGIEMLHAISREARTKHLGIHIFVMELLTGETLRTIIRKPTTTPEQKRDACNNVAIAVIMTFLKSLFWSRDQHGDNAMISGVNTFTLDYGLMYHLLNDEGAIKKLLDKLLNSKTIVFTDVLKYFGVVILTGMTKTTAKVEVRRIFNELYEKLKDVNLKEQLLINPAADRAAEIDRISGIVFQMLSFFALVDGLTNRYKHGEHHFQSMEYMEHVFTQPALHSFEDFLSLCSIDLSTFGPPGSTVRQNMGYIVERLQPSLACSGAARTVGEVRLGPFSLSPGEIAHRQAIQQRAEDAAAAAAVEAIRMKELAAATSTVKSDRPRSRSREAQSDRGTVTVLDILSPEDEDDMSTYEKYKRHNKHGVRLKNLKPEEIKAFKDLQDRKNKLYAEDLREEIEDEIRHINSKQHDLVTERELGKGGKSRKSSKSSKSRKSSKSSKSRKSRKSRKYSRN